MFYLTFKIGVLIGTPIIKESSVFSAPYKKETTQKSQNNNNNNSKLQNSKQQDFSVIVNVSRGWSSHHNSLNKKIKKTQEIGISWCNYNVVLILYMNRRKT